jgi:hypothetical protein
LSHIDCGRGWWSDYKCEGKPHLMSKLLGLREVQDHLTLVSERENIFFFFFSGESKSKFPVGAPLFCVVGRF